MFKANGDEQMTNFNIRFHRYSSKTGQSRLSGRTSILAENFREAADKAHLMLSAAQAADPDHNYIIASIEHDRLTAADEGMDFTTMIWETCEEFSERVSTN